MDTLSSRAQPFLASACNTNSYGAIHVSLLGDTFDADTNPNGAILMSIAENKLCNDIMLESMQKRQLDSTSILNYTDPTGVAKLKSIMADCLTDTVFKLDERTTDNGEPVPRVRPDQIIISAGCTGLLFQLSVLLFEIGDSILIPSPYYPAFDQDFGYLGCVNRVPIDPSDLSTYDLTEADLDTAYSKAVKRGQPAKAMLLTNPHNPLGKVYRPDELLLAVTWCRAHKIHLIVDEIYALSVFDTTVDGPFSSVAAVLNNELGDFVHILWGVSKDLGGSGLRVGVLYSQNTALLSAVGAFSTAFQVSNAIQYILADVLADRTFLNSLVATNIERIRTSYQLISSGLTRLGIPHRPAGAGIFLFADMRRLLKEPTFAAEGELHRALAREIKWSLTPGGACHHPVPGFFRVCYCWVFPTAIEECLRRLERFIASKQL